MKNFYYSLEVNLENEHVREHLATNLKSIVSDDTMDFSVNSRFFTDSQECFNALNEDLNKKVSLFKLSKSKNPVTSINETNPLYTITPEELEEHKKENPDLDMYLETWGEKELMRLTYTTEEFEEDDIPILSDDNALLFRYVMHELEDDLNVPPGSMYVEHGCSSMVH